MYERDYFLRMIRMLHELIAGNTGSFKGKN
jgi:hypothetical protein